MAGLEEGDPVGDHLRRVARRRPVPGRQQRDVPLPGPVEGVPAGAAQRRRVRRRGASGPAQTGQASRATARPSSGGRRAHRARRDGVEDDVPQLAVVGDRGHEGAVRLAAAVGGRARG